MRLLALLLLLCSNLAYSGNLIDPLVDPPHLIFKSKDDAQKWLKEMSARLLPKIPDEASRHDFLVTLQYESSRAGIDPQLVLSLIEVLSDFQQSLVNGQKKGYMQVDQKWVNEIGNPGDNLLLPQTNLRYGCTILRYNLDKTHGDLFKALELYLGEASNSDFPNKVAKVWHTHWQYSGVSNVLTKQDIESIVSTYTDNEMRFDKLYLGKYFEDNVKMQSLRNNFGWTIYFDAGNNKGIYCEISNQQASNLSDLNPNDNLYIKGKVKDVNSLFHAELVLEDCTIERR